MQTSTTITKLAASLIKAQIAMSAAKKDAANPFFKSKYADLPAVIEAIKDPLNNNGIAFLQVVTVVDGTTVIETVLLHESGEFISGTTPVIVAKANDPQAMGSAITYAKRYGLQAIAGLPTEDDDGNKAAGRTVQAAAKVTPVKPREFEL